MNMNDNHILKKNLYFIAVALFLTILYFFMRGSPWHGSAQLHTLMETIATMLAFGIGIGGLTRFYAKPDEKLFLFIGAGFLGTGFLDAYHTFVTSEHFHIFFPSPPESLIPWSWIASRLFLSVFMFFAYFDWYKQYKYSHSPKRIYIIAIISTLVFFLFFSLVPLPKAYYDEYFFHRPEEFLPALFFAIALYGFYTKGGWKKGDIEYWIVLSLIVNFITQTVFMSFSSQLFDYEFDMAHLLKKVSYIAVLTGIYINMTRSFRNESRAVEQITQAKKELDNVNLILNAALEAGKYANSMLKVEKQRYQTMMKSSSDSIFIIDLEGRLIECSQQAAQMFGYSMQEMTKLYVYDWDVAHTKEEAINRVRNVPTEPISFETKHRRKDGSVFDASGTAVKIHILDKDYIYASIRDITEYNQQNSLIKLMQSRYTSMFNNHSSVMLLVDPISGAIIDANESAYRFYGYSHDEFISLSIDDINLLPRDEIALHRQESLEREKNLFVFHHKLKNGDIRTVEVFASPIETENGKLIFSIITDVTEAKENEDRLNEFNRNFEAFLYQTTDFIYFKDINSHIRFCSQTLATITEHDDWHDMIGKHDREIFPAHTAKIYEEEEYPVLTDGIPLLNKIDPYYDSTGSVGYVMTNKWPLLDQMGKVAGIFGISRDITERLKIEEELKKLLKEQEAFLKVQTASLIRIKNRKFDSVSDFMTTQLGYTREEIVGQDVKILYVYEEEYKANGQIIHDALSIGKPCEIEYAAKRKDGSIINLLVGFTPIEGYPDEAIGVAVDITKQKMTEFKLTKAFRENDHLLNIIDHYVSFVNVDMDGIIKDISSNFCKQLGCLKQDMIGGNINVLKSGETPKSLYKKMWDAVAAEKSFICEIKNKNFDNGANWYRISISPDYDEHNKVIGYIAFYENIDDQMMFKTSSETDKLTDLPNRIKIDEILGKELLRANRYNQPFSVILIDIDHFKEVNDQFGHQTGDLILQEFAKIVSDTIRITDVVGRWGGEEFLVICPHTDEKGAFSLAETLRKTIESNVFSVIKQKTASFGVAQYYDGNTLEDLFRNVDNALYSAKNTGRNRVATNSEFK